MKKWSIALTFLALALSACKKEYSCYCSTGIGGAPYQKGDSYKDTKSKATSTCNSMAVADEECHPVYPKSKTPW